MEIQKFDDMAGVSPNPEAPVEENMPKIPLLIRAYLPIWHRLDTMEEKPQRGGNCPMTPLATKLGSGWVITGYSGLKAPTSQDVFEGNSLLQISVLL